MDHRIYGVSGYRGKERRRWIRSAPKARASIKTTVAEPAVRPSGRHGAIRNTLSTPATYKSWSAKVRMDWEEQG